MTDCSKIPTLALVEESKKGMNDIVQFAEGPGYTYVSELDSVTRKTILGIEKDAQNAYRLGAANPQGDYAVGVTFDESNWTYTYNGQQWGLSDNFDLSTLPYIATEPDPNNDTANLAVRGDASQGYVQTEVTRGQNDIIRGSIFKGSNGEYVQNGDVVPVGTTHLLVLIGGKHTIVAMSPVADGVVGSLNDSGATIGSKQVSFNNTGTKEFDYLYDSSGELVVDGAVFLGDRVVATSYHEGIDCPTLFFKVVPAGTGTHDGGKYIDLPIIGLQLEQNLSKPYNVKQWGAKGVNFNDDTSFLNEAFSSEYTPMMVPDGEYGISATISVTQPNTYLYGSNGNTLKALSTMSTMLSLDGENQSCVSIGIDGDKRSPIGINVPNDNFSVWRCRIKNLYGTTGGCLGVSVSALGKGSICWNDISNLDAINNGSTGDAIGAVRAISVFTTQAARLGRVEIANNNIDGILGEEGDAIQVGVTSSIPYGDGLVDVYANSIKRCTRRAVKIQAANCNVYNNTYTHELTEVESPIFAAVVEFIGCENGNAYNNTLDGISGIAISILGSGYKVKGMNVFNNRLKAGYKRLGDAGWTKGTQIACRIEDTEGANASFNDITGGVAGFEWVKSSDFNCYGNKDVDLEESAEFFVLVQQTCDNYRIWGNSGNSENFVREKFIYGSGAGPIIFDNHARYKSSELYYCVQITSTAYGPYIFNCTSECNVAPTVSIPSSFLFPNIGNISNRGNGGSGWFKITYGTTAPTVLRWDRGDIVYNSQPSVGQPKGWQCTSSGTPGTWVSMGNL